MGHSSSLYPLSPAQAGDAVAAQLGDHLAGPVDPRPLFRSQKVASIVSASAACESVRGDGGRFFAA